MRIQINTDDNIKGSVGLEKHVDEIVNEALGHLASQITRVEVHLSDENSEKGGRADKRCMMEARVEGLQPTAVTHQASAIDDAIVGAVDKLKKSLDSTLGRLRGR
jgi:ribosome-associated translation inhibitor RaiA